MKLRIRLPLLLAALAFAALVPLIAFSLFALAQFSDSIRRAEEERVLSTARAISANVDREIAGMIATATALSVSTSLVSGDFAEFYDEAEQAVRHNASVIILLDLNLQQLVNTRLPYGTALPVSAVEAETRSVIESRAPYVSNLVRGRITGQFGFNVVVPVIIGDQARYLLVKSSPPSRLDTLLAQQELPEGWTVATSDRKRMVIASTGKMLREKPFAFPWSEDERALRYGGLSPSVDIEGRESVMAYKRSPVTGWTTSVWVPEASLDAPFASTWRSLLAASLAAVLLSGVLAYLASWPLASLIGQTRRAAAALGRGDEIPAIRSVLSEGADIQSTLAGANEEMRARQREAEEGKALFDTLLENIPEGVTIVGGPDFKVLANSRKAAEWAGRSTDRLTGVDAASHAEAFGVRLADGTTRPKPEELPLYRASRHGERIDGEHYVMARPDGTHIRIEVHVNPVLDAAGRIIGAVSCWRDVTQRVLADQLIADSERRLTLALSVARMAILDVDLESRRVASATNSETVLGIDPTGKTLDDTIASLLAVVHPGDRDRIELSLRHAVGAVGHFSHEFRLHRHDGAAVWIETRGETLAGEDGVPARFLGANVDITARKRSEEHLRLVMRELSHRAKNLLSVILGVATQTARRKSSLAEFLDDFSQRVKGLAASHDLLVNADWAGAALEELVRTQLAPFGGVDGNRIAMSGPPIMLKPAVLQNLGLAFHELATNAVKYGALSVPQGKVDIEWRTSNSAGEPRFHLRWSEKGGPRVKAPSRKGFGHVIVDRSIAHGLSAVVKLDFPPSGVVWTVEAALDAIASTP